MILELTFRSEQTEVRNTFRIDRESYEKVLEAFTLQNGGV